MDRFGFGQGHHGWRLKLSWQFRDVTQQGSVSIKAPLCHFLLQLGQPFLMILC
jgi:hypothetical protein